MQLTPIARATRAAYMLLTALLLGSHPTPVHAAATATFITTDSTTQGGWKGGYGGDGYDVVADTSSNNPSVPSYAADGVSGASAEVYSTSSSDPRALQAALPRSSHRIAADYYSATHFSVNINTTDGKPHQLALYMEDWDNSGRTQTITIQDASSLAVLDTEPVSAFSNGVYLIWRITGHILVTVTNTGTSPSAVLNGWFFDYPGPILSSVSVAPTSASVAEGASETFTATGLDQDGNPLTTQPTFTWTLSGGGTITSAGVFTANHHTGGPFKVKATASGISGSSTLNVASTHTVTFGPVDSISVTGQTGAFVTDLDGDGHPDIVVSTSSGGLVFFYGHGDGTFTQVNYPYTVTDAGGRLAAGDLKGNGRTDLVYPSGNGVGVIMNLGSRTFAAPVVYAGAPGSNAVALGDFNEDGKLDIANVGSSYNGGGYSNDLAILLNNDDGTFGAPANCPVQTNYYGYCGGVTTLDVNSDGHLDIVVAVQDELAASVADIFLGDGLGNFVRPVNWSVNVGGGEVVAADLNNDGILDLANSDHWAGQPRWALGDGKGGFPEQYTQGGDGYASGVIAVADFDGDGFQDLFDAFDSVQGLYINNGDGTFPPPVVYHLALGNLIAGDFNEDGQPDVVLSGSGSTPNNIYLYLNTTNPAPTITNLVPDGALVGGSQTLVVHGHGLLSRSAIDWNGTPLTTTFDYKTGTLSASLTPTQLAAAGTALVTVTTASPGGGTSNSLPFYVGHAPTSIRMSPPSPLLQAGATEQLYATMLDQNGVAMPTQPVMTWKTAGLDDTIVSSGLFSAGNTPGSFSATASYDGLTGTAPITITDFSLSANPSSVTASLSGETSIGVTPIDGFNQPVRLTASGLPAGVIATFNQGSTETSSKLTFTVTSGTAFATTPVTITGTANGNPHTVTVNLTVKQTLTSITVSPGPTVTLGPPLPKSQQFTATAYDQFGNALSPQPAFTWSLASGSVGSVNSVSGLYHSGTVAGSATVRAKSGSVMGTSSVTVN